MMAVLVLAVALGGCGGGGGGGGGGDQVPQLVLDGTWTGPVQDSVAGDGEAHFILTQTDETVTGTWRLTFDDPSFNNQGTVTGTVAGDDITGTLTPDDPLDCPFEFNATLIGQEQMTGDYTAVHCSIAVTGDFTVLRQ